MPKILKGFSNFSVLQLVWVFLYNIWTLIVRSWHKWHTDVPLCLPTSKFKDTGTPEVHYFFLDAPIGSKLLNIDIIYIFLIGRSVNGPLSKLFFFSNFKSTPLFSICRSCMPLCCPFNLQVLHDTLLCCQNVLKAYRPAQCFPTFVSLGSTYK